MIWLIVIAFAFLFAMITTFSYIDRRLFVRLSTRREDLIAALNTGLTSAAVITFLASAITFDFAEFFHFIHVQ